MKALLLCASHNDLGLILSLKKLGYEVVVTGSISGLIGEKYADKYIRADYSDKEAILRIAREECIDVICPCCNDFGVYTAAYIAEQMGLPGYDSYETTLTINNKDKFKELAKELDICTPKSEGFTDVESALSYIGNIGMPVIVKPTDASAGNGITKLDNGNTDEEVKAAVEYAFSKSKAGRIVVDRYISGTQHGFCTFLINQKVVAVCSNNEYSIINPYRVEIDTYPADNYDLVSQILIEQIERIARHLKLADGIFHLQYIESEGTPYIIEVMRRVLGNMYSVPGNMLTGINWDYWEVKARCGLSLDDFPATVKQEGYYAYKTILANTNGRIRNVTIPEKYDKYIVDKCILKNTGDEVTNYKSQPVGFLFMIFSSMEEMKKVLIEEYVNDMVDIDNIT